jgi:hypothetical protein
MGWLDLLAFRLQSLLITFNMALADLHTLQVTVAHAIGFSVYISRHLATVLNIGTSTLGH